jgi:hypothetical protein
MKLLVIGLACLLVSALFLIPKLLTTPTILTAPTSSIPLPTGQDIVRTFFNLINEKRIPDAISMMEMTQADDTTKQSWGVYLNSFEKVTVKDIKACKNDPCTEVWNSGKEIYEVNLDVLMKPESAKVTIPYYGWGNGLNTRWVVIQKNQQGIWKIVEIATGP